MLLLTNTQKQLKSIGLLENQTSNSFIGWRLTWGELAGQEINLDHLLIRIVVLNLSWRILRRSQEHQILLRNSSISDIIEMVPLHILIFNQSLKKASMTEGQSHLPHNLKKNREFGEKVWGNLAFPPWVEHFLSQCYSYLLSNTDCMYTSSITIKYNKLDTSTALGKTLDPRTSSTECRRFDPQNVRITDDTAVKKDWGWC